MHSVVQTDDFVRDAAAAGLSADDVFDIVTRLSENPTVGDLIPGTGGARKWRIPAKGKGKRSGGRVVSYYAADDVPVFLLNVFVKGDRIDLTQAERNELRAILADLADDYRAAQRRKVAGARRQNHDEGR